TTTLAPTQTTTCTATYTLTQADVDSGTVTNTATATGTSPGNATVTSDPSTATITTDRSAALTLVKSADRSTVSAVGDTISYTFLITNTGTVTLSAPSVTETSFSGSGTAPVVDCGIGVSLAPTQAATCTATYDVTQADLDSGSIVNTATATANPPSGVATPVSDPSTVTVGVNTNALVTVVKSADTTQITAAGQQVTYSFAVTNLGNVTLSSIRIDETTFSGTGTLADPTCPTSTLAPQASETCTVVYTTTQADVDAAQLSNTATASGLAPGATIRTVSDPSQVTIVTIHSPALTMVKSVSPEIPADYTVGRVLTYSFLVTNTGNVTLKNVAINETSFTGSGALSAISCPSGLLAPAAQATCTATYTLTQADIDAGSVHNTATATGTPDSPGVNSIVPSQPSEVTVPAAAAPSATVVKTADVASVTHVGQTVSYSFTITNTGNTTLTDPKVNDTKFSGTGRLGAVTCPSSPSSLLPGQTIVCKAGYTVTKADLTGKPLTNTATASVVAPSGSVTTDPSTARVATVKPTASGTGSGTGTGTGTGTTPSVGSVLAFTGSNPGRLVGFGALLLLGGAVIVIARRVRRRRS
ncbi:MAG: hypothetical protein JWP75_3321, partial [Frondihabitans sp.]|nr:hypothetical protein [Frondihabitans sp.]